MHLGSLVSRGLQWEAGGKVRCPSLGAPKVGLGQAGCTPILSKFWALQPPLARIPLLNCPHRLLSPAVSLVSQPQQSHSAHTQGSAHPPQEVAALN